MSSFDKEAVRKDLLEILAKVVPAKAAQVSLDAKLYEDLGLDSFASMELLSQISKKWQIEVEMEDMLNIETVGGVADFLEKLLREAKKAG